MAAKKKQSGSKPSSERIERTCGQPGIEPGQHALQFPVVGIGASAGGLNAFKRLFAAMPADSGMAFIVVPHLDPKHPSLMVELLARQTAMPVCEARDGMPIEQNRVYIIPPSSDLSISQGRLKVVAAMESRGSYTVLDDFFRSLAEDQQEMAIGMILSGTGSHGTPGLREIKAAGGMIVAQDPETAEYDQMPQNAIDTGMVDYILAPEAIPETLARYARQSYLHAPIPMPADDAIAAQIEPVLELLHSAAKYDFRFYRKNMLNRRIQRRMGICQIDQVSNYVAYLREHPGEMTALYKDLLIGVTAFFRDSEAFETLRKQVIPELIERQSGDLPVRVWVPACATGEEAYSIAILLLEQFAAAKRPPNFQIFASDIDEESVEIARRGVYVASALGEVSPERIQQFFVKTDENHFQVNKQLRGSIVITRQNVIHDAPFSKLDLISCRNLLIYLEPELQNKIFSLFHFALNERGALFLGCSESIGRYKDLFEPVSKKWRVFRRIGPARHDLVQVPIVADEGRRMRVLPIENGVRTRKGFVEMMRTALLARFAPAAVLINRTYEVLSLFGRTSDYLELPTGELTRDLLSLARQGLRTRIRAACHKVLSGGDATATIDARVSRNGTAVACTITVDLIQEPAEAAGLLLVVLQDRTEEEQQRSGSAALTEEESATVRQLEHEVAATRDELQNTIEELQSSNEEVTSMNEELQSANEELETSKEELQSFNEELTTVNSQLQDKVDELERANNDFQNLLNSTQIATVFLDTDLRIKRFTPATTPLLHLMESDVGRPIRDFALRFTDQKLLQDAGRVLDTLMPVETEVCSEDGRCYLRRAVPYRMANTQVEGVAITFVDITERIEAEKQSRRLSAVLRDSNDAVMLLELDGRIASWNRGAERLYGYTPPEAGALRFNALVREGERVEQETLIGRVARGEEITAFDTRRVTKTGVVLQISSTITRLADDRGNPIAIAVTDRDITERKRTEQALVQSEQRMRGIVDTAADAIITTTAQGIIDGFNTAAERMFGYSRDEAIGQNVQILMPSPFADEHDDYLSRYVQSDSHWIIGIGRELVGRRKDGSTFPLDLTVSEMRDGTNRTFTGIVRDTSERKSLLRELLMIASEEQRRVGLDLHDSVGQKLTGLGMLAGSLAETLKLHSQKDAGAAQRIAAGIENALELVRNLSKGLLPVEIDAEGLSAALTELAEATTRDSGVKCEFDCDAPVPIEDNETATHFYRIVQEAVTNAVKHGARRVNVSLRRDGSQIILTVRDNGKGISAAALQAQGIGLKTMRFRAGLIGATLSIAPIKKRGTLVICRLTEKLNHDKTPAVDR